MMMESNEISSQEKLERMFNEGKITREDYERLLRSMEHGRQKAENQGIPLVVAKLPWQVWTCIGILVVAGLIQIPLLIGKDPVTALVILAVTIPLVYGLYRKSRWAFIVFIAFCLLSLIGIFKNPGAVLLNFILGFILLTSYPHFFRKDGVNGNQPTPYERQ